MPESKMRIQKFLSQQKIASRREAERLIQQGLVRVNGKVAQIGAQINPAKDKVEIAGQPKETNPKITVAFNKPRDIVCSRIESEGRTIFQLLPQFSHLNAVGRLDKDSEGLILLSNDGVITAAVTSEKHLIEKEYQVRVREEISQWHMKQMEAGIKLEDGLTLPAKAKLLDKHDFSLIIKEGRKHQIRRMCAALNLTVERLKRIRIGNIGLGGLKAGDYRILNAKEIAALKSTA